jgi:CrcB protein
MTFLELSMIGLGGFLGAIIRYFISKNMNRAENIPVGTLLVNLAGCLLIGCVFGMELSTLWTFFLTSGLAGALTTFSTLNKEVLELWKLNKKIEAISYMSITFGAGILLAFVGYMIYSR